MNKQYIITTIGIPKIEKLSTLEQKSFYSTLLSLMTEYYRNERHNDKANELDCSANTNDTDSG